MAKLRKIKFKSGDDFSIGLTVTNKSSEAAIAANTAMLEAQAAHDAAIAANPQDPALIASTLVTLDAAKLAYAEAIVVDITTWGITSSIKWLGKLIAPLTVTKTEPLLGKFEISKPAANTVSWKPRVHDVDVQFEINGKKTSSQTFQIDVVRDVTNE